MTKFDENDVNAHRRFSTQVPVEWRGEACRIFDEEMAAQANRL